MTSRHDLAGDGIKLSRCFHRHRAGHAAPAVQILMRHSSLATTVRYLAVSTNQQRAALNLLPSGDLQGDGVEGVLDVRTATCHR